MHLVNANVQQRWHKHNEVTCLRVVLCCNCAESARLTVLVRNGVTHPICMPQRKQDSVIHDTFNKPHNICSIYECVLKSCF